MTRLVQQIFAEVRSTATVAILRRLLLAISAAIFAAMFASTPIAAATQPRILVYTRNYTPDGKGYVHDNIAASVEAIQKMGAEKGFAVDYTDNPNVFSNTNLKQYAAIIFSNSDNEAFSSDAQREAFKHYIESGAASSAFTPQPAPSVIGPTIPQCWAENSRPTQKCSPSPYGSPILISRL